jgi:hypothetical protein
LSTIIDGSASVTINSGAVLGITSGTAVASTSGTSIDFTSIPSWVKRITVMLSGVSVSGTSNILFQVGSGSIISTGYNSESSRTSTAATVVLSTAGIILFSGGATEVFHGLVTFCLLDSNKWVASYACGQITPTGNGVFGGGSTPALGGALDRVRITTVNGTDTFDAGTINILYE